MRDWRRAQSSGQRPAADRWRVKARASSRTPRSWTMGSRANVGRTGHHSRIHALRARKVVPTSALQIAAKHASRPDATDARVWSESDRGRRGFWGRSARTDRRRSSGALRGGPRHQSDRQPDARFPRLAGVSYESR
jgi:hypothetical protein